MKPPPAPRLRVLHRPVERPVTAAEQARFNERLARWLADVARDRVAASG